MAEGRGGEARAEARAERPAEAVGGEWSGILILDHRGEAGPEAGSEKGFEKGSDVGGRRVGAPPGRGEVAPVGAVPIPGAGFGRVAEVGGGVFDLDGLKGGQRQRAGAEGGVLHVEWLEELALHESGEGLATEAFGDDGGKEDAGRGVTIAGAGGKQQGGGEGEADEFAERSVALAEGGVLGEHVGEAGGVGEELADGDGGAFGAGELGQVAGGGLAGIDFAERQQRGGGHGFGNGGDEEAGIGLGGAEGAEVIEIAFANQEHGGAGAGLGGGGKEEFFEGGDVVSGERSEGKREKRAAEHGREFIRRSCRPSRICGRGGRRLCRAW